jgi:hypothetical protein
MSLVRRKLLLIHRDAHNVDKDKSSGHIKETRSIIEQYEPGTELKGV